MSAAGRGFLRGQLITGLESAVAALDGARRAESLLDDADRLLLWQARETIRGIEQRAYAARGKRKKP